MNLIKKTLKIINPKEKQLNLSTSCNDLKKHITTALFNKNPLDNYFLEYRDVSPSAVLLLIGQQGENSEPCLILNKRSQKVKQPGDLCCPGGGLMPGFDLFLARFLGLPGFPLGRWKYWAESLKNCPEQARNLSLFLANGLREGFEEMRLNPLGVSFLGLLEPQPLIMFRRVIYPLVGWVENQRRFFPNWEVEKIVNIPLKSLLNPDSYACYRLEFSNDLKKKYDRKTQDFPCFIHYDKGEREILWGATFRIIAGFLDLIMGFQTPETEKLPVIHRLIENNYVTGKKR